MESTGLSAQRLEYDARGRIATAIQADRTTTLGYDAAGNLATRTNALHQTDHFAYDAAGRLLSQQRSDGEVIDFSYDEVGNLASITPPGQPAHVFTYTPDNRVETYLAPQAADGAPLTRYNYDLNGRVRSVEQADGEVVQTNYDSPGRLSSVVTPQGTTNFAYAPTTGLLSSITGPAGVNLAYTYDGTLITGMTWTGSVAGTLTRSYDNFFRVASEGVAGTTAVNYTYDNDGLLLSAGPLAVSRDAHTGFVTTTALGIVTDVRTYDRYGAVASYAASSGGSQLYRVQLDRDALGRIVHKLETTQGASTDYQYDYDEVGRLIGVAEGGALTRQYEYDGNGNRVSLQDTTRATATTGTYDTQDRLLQYAARSYAYAADGALSSITDSSTQSTTSYAYDALGNLRTVTLPDGRAISYLVDGLNQRVAKSVNGARQWSLLYRSPLQPVAMLNASNTVVARYVYADAHNVPDYMIANGVTYRFVTDTLGSVRLVVNATTGTVAQRMDYYEFGNVLANSNPGFQPFGFGGGLYEADTGIVRFGARDYDAKTGRWTSKDPVLFSGGDVNLYRYATGDPVNLSDVNGRDVCIHTSNHRFHHEWISFNNDPKRSYGAYPTNGSFWADYLIDHPDGNWREMFKPDTKTICHKSTPDEDRRVEDWIRDHYDLKHPEKNAPYIFGVHDCRHFVEDVTKHLWQILGNPQTRGGEGAGGGGGGGSGG